MAKSEVICEYCNKRFLRENRHINRNKKLGLRTYCSQVCATYGMHERGVFDHLKTGRSEEAHQRQLERQRRWYEKNKETHKQKRKDRYYAISAMINSFRVPCVICGESSPVCLDFHHRNPEEKLYTICHMARWNCSKKKIIAEVEKCVVLCANCHRKLHAGIIAL